MKRYSVTMTYWKNVEVLANNSREAREKAHSGDVEKDYGLTCDDQDQVELLENIFDIEELQRLNKKMTKVLH